MYKGENGTKGIRDGDMCQGRSCVRRVRKNRGWSHLCIARWFDAKLAKDGDVTANSVVSHSLHVDTNKGNILGRIVSIREPNHFLQIPAIHLT